MSVQMSHRAFHSMSGIVNEPWQCMSFAQMVRLADSFLGGIFPYLAALDDRPGARHQLPTQRLTLDCK